MLLSRLQKKRSKLQDEVVTDLEPASCSSTSSGRIPSSRNAAWRSGGLRSPPKSPTSPFSCSSWPTTRASTSPPPSGPSSPATRSATRWTRPGPRTPSTTSCDRRAAPRLTVAARATPASTRAGSTRSTRSTTRSNTPRRCARCSTPGKTPAGAHVPILTAEILEALDPQPGDTAVDCTLGYGGHARAMLQRIQPGGTLLGLDVDPLELPKTEARMRRLGFGPDVFVARRSNFAGLPAALAAEGLAGADCLLADLGVSSMQLDTPGRGFSFKTPGPLDMRMNPNRGQPASALLRAARAGSTGGAARGERRRAARRDPGRCAGRPGPRADLRPGGRPFARPWFTCGMTNGSNPFAGSSRRCASR